MTRTETLVELKHAVGELAFDVAKAQWQLLVDEDLSNDYCVDELKSALIRILASVKEARRLSNAC